MNNKISQQDKALQFHKLHQSNDMLILPNIWDVLGARLLESLGYKVVATASAAIAFTHGYEDDEKIPYNYLLKLFRAIANSVSLPVTVDIESGYAYVHSQLQKNIQSLIETGIVGINIEDTNHLTRSILPIKLQSQRIRLIRKVADEMGIALFINARTDVLLHSRQFTTPNAQLDEMIKRGVAYKEAGADCFFPITIRNKEHIQVLVSKLSMPINVLTLKGIPDLNTLKALGVRRVSLGPSLLKAAIKAMKTLAEDLKEYKGLDSIIENEVTSDYLKSLINK